MKRIASLSIFFAALIEFAIERAKFDLWIAMVVAIVTLLWNLVGRALRSPMESQKHHDRIHNLQDSQSRPAKQLTDLERTQSAVTPDRK
jgi:hypothetical protein